MWSFLVSNAFLLGMGALEIGQAAVDVVHGNWGRATTMLCAAVSSTALIWWKV